MGRLFLAAKGEGGPISRCRQGRGRRTLDARNVTRYADGMIIGFRHKGLERFYRTGSTRGIQATHTKRLAMILAMLDAANEPKDMEQPGLRLHPLKGALKGHWSVWVNGNWRVTFRFAGSDVELVDYQDYH